MEREPRYDKLLPDILTPDGKASGFRAGDWLNTVGEQAAEMWSAEWQGVRFKLGTKRVSGLLCAWLLFASEADATRYARIN